MNWAQGEGVEQRIGGRTSAYARHSSLSGHSSHFGALGVHTVAPSSINPWFHAPGLFFPPTSSSPSSSSSSFAFLRLSGCGGTSTSASAQMNPVVLFALSGACSAVKRLRTRITLPSTMALRCPNAMDEMAPAE